MGLGKSLDKHMSGDYLLAVQDRETKKWCWFQEWKNGEPVFYYEGDTARRWARAWKTSRWANQALTRLFHYYLDKGARGLVLVLYRTDSERKRVLALPG